MFNIYNSETKFKLQSCYYFVCECNFFFLIPKIYSSLAMTVTECNYFIEEYCMLKYNPFHGSKKIPGKEQCALRLVDSLKLQGM